MPTATKPQAGPRLVTVGDQVVFDQIHAATVARVHLPAEPDSPVDLTYVDSGVLRVAKQVPHKAGPGAWRWKEEAHAEKIMSPLELLDAARARGERVPNLGDWITYGFEKGLSGYIHVLPTRARIVAVNSLTHVDIEVYPPRPPEDPEEEDTPINFGLRRNVGQAESAPDGVRKLGYGGTWAYPDSGLIRPFGPVERWTIFPSFVCRCGAPGKVGIPVFIGEPSVSVGDPSKSNLPVVKLCQACVDELRRHILRPEGAVLAPA